MDYENIKASLNHKGVDGYIAYLKSLEEDKTMWWFKKVNEDHYIELYKRSVDAGLYIDGDTVTIDGRNVGKEDNKRLQVSLRYGHQAYKNLVLLRYPEAVFDFQCVYSNDTFTVQKNSGKVTYVHTFGNVCDTTRKVVGAYGVIKCSIGEFIETINLNDINKMKATATTTNIWDTWFSEMVLKSVIKRLCKRHFKDVVRKLEEQDNENYTLQPTAIDESIEEKVSGCTSLHELAALYKIAAASLTDTSALVTLCAEKKKTFELRNPIADETADSTHRKLWDECLGLLKQGSLMRDVKWHIEKSGRWISPENEEALVAQVDL